MPPPLPSGIQHYTLYKDVHLETNTLHVYWIEYFCIFSVFGIMSQYTSTSWPIKACFSSQQTSIIHLLLSDIVSMFTIWYGSAFRINIE